jgi:hypothetical protein
MEKAGSHASTGSALELVMEWALKVTFDHDGVLIWLNSQENERYACIEDALR